MSSIKNIIDKGISEYYLDMDKTKVINNLEKEGVDVSSESAVIDSFINRMKLSHAADINEKKSNELLDIIAKRFHNAIHKNIDKPIATIRALIESKQLSVQFRNLDKLSEEDIKDIIKNKNLVDLMDELDNEQKTE